MTTIDDKTTFALHPHYRFQWEEAQQSHVLLYPEGMITLSDTAAAILQRCQEPTSLSTLIDNLHQAFPDAERDMIAQDVREFVADAARQGWLRAEQ